MWRLAPRRMRRLMSVLAALVTSCQGAEPSGRSTEEPALLTSDLPFRYPASLYAQRVEGEVGLRLFVDSLGLVVPESTRVAEPSTHAEFDSAAVAGAPFLEFRPASEGGSRVGRPVVLPVKFRLPADSARRDTFPRSR